MVPWVRRLLLVLFQATGSALALWWVFRAPETRRQFAEVWWQAEAPWMVAGVACAGIMLALSWWRWSFFLAMQSVRLPKRRLVAAGLIGAFFDLLLPGTAGGDAAKAVFVCRETAAKKTPVILSLFADHLSGLLALAAFAVAFAGARHEAFADSPLAFTSVGFTMGFLVLALILVVLSFTLTTRESLDRMPRWLPARPFVTRLCDVWRLFLADRPRALAAVGISFAIYFAHFTTFYCAARALDVRVSLPDMLAIGPVVDVVTMIPVSVSGLGVRESLFEALLARLAAPPPGAAAAVSLAGFGCLAVWGAAGAVVMAAGGGWKKRSALGPDHEAAPTPSAPAEK